MESPTKAKKIQSFLGSGYTVKSSKGHIRDLDNKDLSVDINNGFEPIYVIPHEKSALVKELKADAKKASTIWLASDEDREGEAIAWHLSQVLELDPAKTKRIVFHEVTKPAILEAVQHPRSVDLNLVDAQQARRVLDRLVGFKLSPVLWKKVQHNLSAGRVQSVALRLIVDREREINAFNNEAYYKVEGLFIPEGGTSPLKAVLDTNFKSEKEALAFLEKCVGASFSVSDVSSKEKTRTPAAPFTTSTLQQEAARKLGFSISTTMQIAQKLYEEGLISYMRTDSVNLSSLAINTAKSLICDNFGSEYSRPRNYTTKQKGAQEAHEAIRPTYVQNMDINGTPQEKKLYSLIWKRTVASQMAEARLLGTKVTLSSPSFNEHFIIEANDVLFDGFLKLYIEGNDEENEEENIVKLPEIKNGSAMTEQGISANCKFTAAPLRYSQASLVKKLEDLQIGRPSTYETIIGTLTKKRGYVVEGDKAGSMRTVTDYTLKNGKITSSSHSEKVGFEKHKLMPLDIGIMVSDFLVEHFPEIMDYSFTANVEADFDKIADGKKSWKGVISDFYNPLSKTIDNTIKTAGYSHMERFIGNDPSDGQPLIAKHGQWGSYVQKGDGNAKTYASLGKGQTIESISLEEAVKLFQLPRTVGTIDGKDVVVTEGRFGAYIKYDGKNISLPKKGVDPRTITIEEAEKYISEASSKPRNEPMAVWGNIQLINGSFGPYLKKDGKNYKLPKGVDADKLDEAAAKQIIDSSEPTNNHKRHDKNSTGRN